MRKLLAVLLALMLLCTAAIAETAESNLTEYDFGDFILTFPADMPCSYMEEKVDGQSFLYLYQDYDPSAVFNKNLNVAWTSEVLDITSFEPSEYIQSTLDSVVSTLSEMDFIVSNPTVLGAEIGSQNGKTALIQGYTMDVDYSKLGVDFQMTSCTLQAVIPDETFGTYTFTVTTDITEDCQLLLDIADSVRWK